MDLSFLSPLSAVVGLAVLIPIAAIALRERRHDAVRAAIGLGAPSRRSRVPAAVALTVAFGLLAAAAAQPVVRVDGTIRQRTDAEAYVLVDITRSMLAASDPDAPRRINRAIDAAIELRRALPDVPFGVATMTNRPLPHLFPTGDREQFELVMRGAVGVNRPPGTKGGLFSVATDFQTLGVVATDNFFSAGARKRLVIMLSDGESDPFAVRLVVTELNKGGVDVVAMRFWAADERVFAPDGTAEPAYRPERLALVRYGELAALTTGGRVYEEDEVDEVAAAARAYLGRGPVVEAPAPGRTVSLAPWAVLAACIPLAALVLPFLRRRRVEAPAERSRAAARAPGTEAAQRHFAYSMLPRWRAFSRTPASRSHAPRAPSPRS